MRQETEVSAQERERNTTLKEKLRRVKAVVLCGPWSEEKRIFLYGVVMQQCSGHVDEDVAIISGGECHGSHISECYRDSEVDSAVGHVDEDVDTISGGECHGSHIDKCYRDSVGTSMRLRGSLSVEGRELKS